MEQAETQECSLRTFKTMHGNILKRPNWLENQTKNEKNQTSKVSLPP